MTDQPAVPVKAVRAAIERYERNGAKALLAPMTLAIGSAAPLIRERAVSDCVAALAQRWFELDDDTRALWPPWEWLANEHREGRL